MFAQVVLITVVLVGYWLGLHLTKPSPLSGLQAWPMTVTIAYGTVLAVITAVVFTGLAVAVDRVAAAMGTSRPVGTVAVKTLLAATAALLFFDNILYSLVGASLRSESGSAAKVAFLLLALSLGLLWALRSGAPSRRVAVWMASLCAVMTAAAGCVAAVYLRAEIEPDSLERSTDPPARSVVILSADGIDADAMSVYSGKRGSTPFLDSISDDLMVYENGFTNNGNTTGSVVSLITGRSPADTGVVYPPDALQQNNSRLSLPHLLRREGYRSTSWAVPHYVDSHSQNLVDAYDVDNGHERPPLAALLPTGSGPPRWFVDDLLQAVTATWADALWLRESDNPYVSVISSSGGVTGDKQRLDGILREISAPGPFFINSHFMVSHGPTFRLPEGTMPVEQQEPWQDSYYTAAIRVFDGYVERVFRALEKASKLDSTIVVITSDHGQHYEARSRVPILIRFPGGVPHGRSRVNVQRMDLAPTILHQLGFEAPEFMPGADLSDPRAIAPTREIGALTSKERAPRIVLGFRPGADPLIHTRIVCRRYEQSLEGDVIAAGYVAGSTATCTAPVVP